MNRQPDSGSTLIVISILAAILIIVSSGVVLLQRINARLTLNYFHDAQAMYLAEGGLAAAEAALRLDPKHRDLLTGELSTGTYRAEFQSDLGRLEANTLILPVEAIGRAGTAKQTLVEIFTLAPYPKHPAFDYGLFQSSGTTDLILGLGLEITGDIFTNSNVSISDNVTVLGTIYSANDVFYNLDEDCPWTFVTGATPQNLPDFEREFYESIATTVISGPVDVCCEEAGTIVFVRGDASLGGFLPPGTAIIASGKLRVDASVRCSEMAYLVGEEGIYLEGPSSLTAVLYSPSNISFLGPVDISGTVVTSKVTLYPGCTISYLDPSLATLPAPLPGLTITRSSWFQKFFVPVINY
ncbi:MAG: hypothetical protein ACOYEO_07300 [bacterium]|jgi:hypothetical protein